MSELIELAERYEKRALALVGSYRAVPDTGAIGREAFKEAADLFIIAAALRAQPPSASPQEGE